MEFVSLKDHKNEELWNGLTHLVGVVLSISGIPFLFYFDNNLSSLSTYSILLFSFGLLFVYSSSTIYHFTINHNLKKRFQILDHISIYYLILGTYGPVCLITLHHSKGIYIFFILLILSLIGTLKKLFYTGKLQSLSLLLYLLMGWLIVFDINSLFEVLNINAKFLLILGGISYTIGVVFYVFDEIKYFHSIWHLFVLNGSTLHYFMILMYII